LGNRAVDEMAHLWLQVLPEPSSKEKMTSGFDCEAMAQHNLQKNPTILSSL